MNNLFQLFCSLSTAVVFGGISLGTAYADMLVLTAQDGGRYDYGLQLDPNHGLVVGLGDQIKLSGLSGITATTIMPGLSFAYTLESISNSSVTIVDTTPFVLDPLPVSHVISALEVSSLASNTGLVDYEIQIGSGGVLVGTVLGPVATVPEPPEFAILFSLTALFALKRPRPPAKCDAPICGRGGSSAR
jgi:hypothetical protein